MIVKIDTIRIEKKMREVEEILTEAGMFSIRKAWLIMVLLFLAIALIGTGTYLNVQPEWMTGQETYNKGVRAYERFVEAERYKSLHFNIAYRLFEKASLEEVTNLELRSYIFYNMGTMLGEKAGDENLPIFVRLELVIAAIDKLRQAINDNPDNEMAKYNREYLIRQLIELYEQAQAKYGEEAVADRLDQIPGQDQNMPSPGEKPGRGDDKDRGF